MTCYNLLGGVLRTSGLSGRPTRPRRVLFAGLALNAIGVLLMGFADAHWLLLDGGNCRIGQQRLPLADFHLVRVHQSQQAGQGLFAHTFSPGGACAPSLLAVVQFYDWRAALISAGIIGLMVLVLMIPKRILQGEGSEARLRNQNRRYSTHLARLILSAPVLLSPTSCFTKWLVVASAFTVSVL